MFIVLSAICEAHYFEPMTAKVQNTLTSLQCRMARVGLRLGILDLAALANVGHSTINRFENELSKSNASTRAALRRAFEEAGVEFIDDCGVIIRKASSKDKM